MVRRLPPLNALKAFEAAARHLNFTEAADELSVTQAAISHQVRALEERLGVQLFRRLPRGLLLTDEGQLLLPGLRDAFDRMAQAVEAIASAEAYGTLTISTLTTFSLSWLVPRLPRFQAAHPEIDVRLMTTPRVVDFAREDVDVAIRHGNGNWPGLSCERLLEERVTPLCGRSFRDRLREPHDLIGCPILQVSDDLDWPIWLRAVGVEGVNLARGSHFDSTKIAVQAAIDGLGVAIGEPTMFTEDILAGRIFQPFDLIITTGKSWWLIAPPRSMERRKVKVFRDWIRAELDGAV